MILYKRNAKGKPIFWKIQDIGNNTIEVCYGIVGREHTEGAGEDRRGGP